MATTTTTTSHPLDTNNNGNGAAQQQPATPLAFPPAAAAPKSRYYDGPPSPTSSPFNRPPPSQPHLVIGHASPLSIIRIERDYSHSAPHVPQFYAAFPLELEKRITPTQCTELINDVNEALVEANHAGWAASDNALAVLSLWIWPLVAGSHYERCMNKLTLSIARANEQLLNPRGLHLIHPARSAFLFLEIEYY